MALEGKTVARARLDKDDVEAVVVDSVGPYLRYPLVTAFAADVETGEILDIVAYRDESVDAVEASLAAEYAVKGFRVLADSNLSPLSRMYPGSIEVDKDTVDDVVYRRVHPRLWEALGPRWLAVRFFGPMAGLGRDGPTIVTRGLGAHIVCGEVLGGEPVYLDDGEKPCRPYLEVPPDAVTDVLRKLSKRGYGLVFTKPAVECVYTLAARGIVEVETVRKILEEQLKRCEDERFWPRRSVAEANIEAISYGLELLERIP